MPIEQDLQSVDSLADLVLRPVKHDLKPGDKVILDGIISVMANSICNCICRSLALDILGGKSRAESGRVRPLVVLLAIPPKI